MYRDESKVTGTKKKPENRRRVIMMMPAGHLEVSEVW